MPLSQKILISSIAGWLIVGLAIFGTSFIVYLSSERDPYIDEYYTHPAILHKPPSYNKETKKPTFEAKRIIRSGSKFYVWREYYMKGDFNNGFHYTWIRHMESGFIYKYPVTSIIGIHHQKLKIPFYYRLPEGIPMGKYELITRLYGKTNAFNKYQQDLTPVKFEVK